MTRPLIEEVYRYVDGEQDIINEQETFTPVEKIEFHDDGVRVFLEGAHYHQRGLASPETLFIVNLAKRHLIEPIKFLNKWYFLPGVFISALNIERVLKSYNDMTYRFLKPHIFHREYMTKVASEIEIFSFNFLTELKVNKHVAKHFSETIGACVEFDSAYRYRILDIFSETNKERLSSPITELRRLMKLMVNRSKTETTSKFVAIVSLFSVVLLIPRFRRAFKSALKASNWDNMMYDEVDKYWMCLRKEEYNYLGMTDDGRRSLLSIENKSLPTLKKRDS